MVVRGVILAAAAALLATGSGPAALAGSAESRVLWQGAVFAGAAVVWGEETAGTGSLHLWTSGHRRIVYTSTSLALTGSLAASRTLLAFERSYPSCAPQPNVACPQAQDALVGPPTGPFRVLVRRRTCVVADVGNALALDGGVAAYLHIECGRDRLQVVARDVIHNGRPVVLHDGFISDGCCRGIEIAGRYVAWSNERRGEVVVFDRLARRLAYRVRVGGPSELGFGLQRDGKVAVAYRPLGSAGTRTATIAWFSPVTKRPHVLAIRGADTRIRIADDHIAVDRYLTPKTSALVVAGLDGRTQTVARFASPVRLRSGFDLDGGRIVWASDRVTATRVDCPPPGQGRPCVRVESGTTTLWLRTLSGGARLALDRLPFVDTVARAGQPR
jgi:hypothetical protein